MKACNSMKLQFEGRSVNEAFSRTAVAAFIAQLDPTIEELSDIKTAVSEAVTNCIVHAYRDTLGIVYITANIFPDSHVSIKIRDKGCGIPRCEKGNGADVYNRSRGGTHGTWFRGDAKPDGPG